MLRRHGRLLVHWLARLNIFNWALNQKQSRSNHSFSHSLLYQHQRIGSKLKSGGEYFGTSSIWIDSAPLWQGECFQWNYSCSWLTWRQVEHKSHIGRCLQMSSGRWFLMEKRRGCFNTILRNMGQIRGKDWKLNCFLTHSIPLTIANARWDASKSASKRRHRTKCWSAWNFNHRGFCLLHRGDRIYESSHNILPAAKDQSEKSKTNWELAHQV